MVPAMHCSFGNVTIFAISSSSPRKGVHSMRCIINGRTPNPLLSQQRYILPPSLPFKLIQKDRSGYGLSCRSRIQILASVGTDVATDETNPAISDEGTNETSEPSLAPPASNETASSGPRTSKRPRSVRKSEMPPLKNEELVPGASFTGKVRSIQPFGAFVDIGAFTDGLVHVSNLSNEFVKDVGSFVSIGEEVKVKILEANMETGRISLTMRDGDDTNKSQPRKEAAANVNNEKPKTPRRNAGRPNQKREEFQKSTKFVKGQVLDGTVKNLTRSGAFISLPEGEEGFLPSSEESEGFTILGSSSLQVGQEVSVRVLRVTRGRVTLTMKKEEDLEELNMQLNQGVMHVATNPFELAFRKNKDIAAFLDEREKLKESSEPLSVSETPEHIEELVPEATVDSGTAIVDETTSSEEQPEETNMADPTSSELVTVDEKPEGTETNTVDKDEPEAPVSQEYESAGKPVVDESFQLDGGKENDSAITTILEDEPSTSNDSAQETVSVSGSLTDESSVEDGIKENGSASKPAVGESFQLDAGKENDSVSVTILEDEPSTSNDIAQETVPVADSLTDESSDEDGIKEASSLGDSNGQNADNLSSSLTDFLSEDVTAKDSADTPPSLDDSEVTHASEDATVAEHVNPEKNDNATSNAQTAVATQGSPTGASISPALVKQLRAETGAGMMDCKKALAEAEGEIIKAQELLSKKGLSSADKRASRATAEGRIGSYIHDNRIGVLIEVNCETDFVSRGDMFKELVDDLAMQVAACPQVQYLNPEDVPEEIMEKERELEMQKEDILTKPEQIRSKIVDGRIRKRVEELALLEQPYIKNDKLAVKDLVKQTIATVGENIKVKRFVRFNLGEGLEKKSQDFAAEVAAQTAARQAPPVEKDKPAETNETPEKPIVAVSAALVKQLREETGAGMMDCKKALTETGGDLEKAQEYLRKKGLSSADKKSSRLAAEGCISSYVHDSRIGILIEVNCETDFVGRNEKFREFVDDLAMQVAACPQVDFVSVEDVPESVVSKEREIEMQREDLKSKPENIREKIVEGRISKYLGELALLEQPFIKDDSLLVKDLVKQTVAALGENIRVRRFARFTLGESSN